MKFILDTHAFIWMDTDPTKVSPRVVQVLNDTNNEIHLSVASVWEMVIKSQTGKLVLSDAIDKIIAEQMKRNPLQLLPVGLPHVLAIQTLPSIHKDPFDRLLVAQAMIENAILLSTDPLIRQYPVRVEW